MHFLDLRSILLRCLHNSFNFRQVLRPTKCLTHNKLHLEKYMYYTKSPSEMPKQDQRRMRPFVDKPVSTTDETTDTTRLTSRPQSKIYSIIEERIECKHNGSRYAYILRVYPKSKHN